MDEEMEARLVLRLDRMEEKMDRALEKLNNLEKRMDMMERDNNNEMRDEEEEEIRTALSIGSDDEETDGSDGEETDRSEDDDWPSNDEEPYMSTAIEKGQPRRKNDWIQWGRYDDEFRQAQEERAANTTSMWAYDRHSLPSEFVNLDKKTFLTDPSLKNLCFLPTNILIKICAMLCALDFVSVSLTCRYLHWRIFTFCTCYTPYKIIMEIGDNRPKYWSIGGKTTPVVPRIVYFFDGIASVFAALPTEAMKQYYLEQRGLHRLYVYQPACLRKPFFFESLELELKLPTYFKADYDRCLPFILAVRKYVRDLELNIRYECSFDPDSFLDYSATNEFFKAVRVNSYHKSDRDIPNSRSNWSVYNVSNYGIYRNCPYTHQMDRVSIGFAQVNEPIFLNRIGWYKSPSDDAIKRTMNEFFHGSSNLEFHTYSSIRCSDLDDNSYPMLEYLFNQYKDFEECYSDRYGHHWYTTITTEETGRKHRLRISKEPSYKASVTIGREKTFAEMEQKEFWHFFSRDEKWYKMETALEPEEDEAEMDGGEAQPEGAE